VCTPLVVSQTPELLTYRNPPLNVFEVNVTYGATTDLSSSGLLWAVKAKSRGASPPKRGTKRMVVVEAEERRSEELWRVYIRDYNGAC